MNNNDDELDDLVHENFLLKTHLEIKSLLQNGLV